MAVMVATLAGPVEPLVLVTTKPATPGTPARTNPDYGVFAPTSAANSSRVDTPVFAHAR